MFPDSLERDVFLNIITGWTEETVMGFTFVRLLQIAPKHP